MKTYSEQVTDLENTRAAKQARMQEVMKKSLDEGRSTDEAEGQEFDTLTDEIGQIDKDLVRLKKLEQMNKEQAVVVDGSTIDKASESRGGGFATVKTVEKLEPGIRMARFAMCIGAAKGDLGTAMRIGQSRFPHDDAINGSLKIAAERGTSAITKAAVDAATTTDTTWAAPLLAYNQFAGDFISYLRPQTIIGKFGNNGIPSLRRVPFNVHIRGQSSGGAGYWVGEGAPKPLTKFDFTDVYLGYTKVANIAVLTEELMRFSNPSAETLVRDALAEALIERMDIDFIDPAKGASVGVSPASITNGVTPVTSSGTTAAAARADLIALWAAADAASLPMDSAVYITDTRTLRHLAMMQNALGQREFPDLRMNGTGTLDGVPVIVSNHVPFTTSESILILAFASEIFLADDGQFDVQASREASLQMLDNPTNNSATGTATTMVSMFQTDSVALRAERYINWKKRRTTAVAYVSGVAYV